MSDLRALGDVSVERGRGIVAVVGAGLTDSGPTPWRARFAALGEVRVHMASLSATGINLTLVLDADQVAPAMQRLHAAFFSARATWAVRVTAPTRAPRIALVGMGRMGRRSRRSPTSAACDVVATLDRAAMP